MDNAYFDAIHIWLQQNTGLIGPAVAMVACLESLVVVGIVLPGVALLFALAAIAGAASISIYPILLWAFLGAVVGDGVSYLLGYHYHERVRGWWPFHRHPQWLERGEDFFREYGFLSIVIGRFVGPVRPIIPAVAGMMGMVPSYFFTVNILSALAWSPFYLLPGYLTGAALQWHDKVPDQLLVVLSAITGVAILLPPLLISAHRHFKPRFIGYLVLVSGLLTLLITAHRAGLLESVNQGVDQWLKAVQLPWLQKVMYWVAQIGSIPVLGIVSAGGLFWLYRSNRVATLFSLLFGGVLMVCSVWLINGLAGSDRSVTWLDLYAFPSVHTTVFVYVLFSFVASVAVNRPFKVQWLSGSVALGLVMIDAFARLVLQVNWFGDVMTGLCLGLFWGLVALALKSGINARSKRIFPV
ncbi:VTT domain-containing protein [Endozoicomonas sp. GU-1]|uniref:VTT domain-containing protein n=1 Tax=Endozoicomonas sp. GU-1 TaxID=3009078 RepID=UPI0022B5E3A4|nr:VTT domain-containing protein [Endozoicomonas sp. GU-1]WBA82754.1 VTT domain-containing protein [Endozoicomonas sp. GU-1]WBA85685.1 VTT domain-containing protein [Endozoicomonas sp. GU-1]